MAKVIKTCGECNWYEAHGKLEGKCTYYYSNQYGRRVRVDESGCNYWTPVKLEGGANGY